MINSLFMRMAKEINDAYIIRSKTMELILDGRNGCARKEQSLLLDLMRVFESSHKSEKTFFLYTCATCSELPSNMNTVSKKHS